MVSVSVSKSRRKNGDHAPKLRRRKKSKYGSNRSTYFKVILIAVSLVIVMTLWSNGIIISPSTIIISIFFSSNNAGNTASVLRTKNQNDWMNGQHFSVVIVGAGISGLTAAKTLEQHSTQVLILEATSQWGGRIRSASKRSITNQRHDVADNNKYSYPIDMGASFITYPKWLPIIAGSSKATTSSNNRHWDWTTTPASEEWKNLTTTAHDMFRNYSWYEFVQDHLLPNGHSESSSSETSSSSSNSESTTKIRYNCVVDKIETKSSSTTPVAEGGGGDGTIKVSCGPSFSVTADAVLVTIPLPLLQEPLGVKLKQQEAQDRRDLHGGGGGEYDDDDNDKIHGQPPPNDDIYDDDMDGGDTFRTRGLQFIPPLPTKIDNRIRNHKAKMLPALKIVFEFKHKFYPDYIDIMKMAEMLKDDDDQVIQDPPDVGVNPQKVYEYWADSEVRYDPKVSRPKGAKHYLVGQLLGDPAFAYWNAFYGPFRQNDYYRKSEFQDDMAKHLLQELINYLEPVEGMDEFLIHQNYVGYQMVHWTKETFMPGILDCSLVKWDNNNKKQNRKYPNQVGPVPQVHGQQLYFAGEAFANLPRSRYHGCGQAHGAAISGKKAALQILHSLDGGNGDMVIPIPTTDEESLVHRDLERFSMIRPEDASDLEFYAPMNDLWPDPADAKQR